jgi:hypothetical protein
MIRITFPQLQVDSPCPHMEVDAIIAVLSFKTRTVQVSLHYSRGLLYKLKNIISRARMQLDLKKMLYHQKKLRKEGVHHHHHHYAVIYTFSLTHPLDSSHKMIPPLTVLRAA